MVVNIGCICACTSPAANTHSSQVNEYHKLKKKASRKTAGLGQQLMRLEQEKQTSEQSLEQVKMKKSELEQRHAQLKEQEYVNTFKLCQLLLKNLKPILLSEKVKCVIMAIA